MKAFALALFLLSFSPASFARANDPAFDALMGNTTYASLSDNVCGLHVEKDGLNLVLTYVANPRILRMRCTVQGETVSAECAGGADCKVKYRNGDEIELRILEDGNFTTRFKVYDAASMTYRRGKLVKFIRWN